MPKQQQPKGYGAVPPPGAPEHGVTIPLMTQPGGAAAGPSAGWMVRPQTAGCPQGLEYLTQVDQILVNQTVELLEAFTGIECQNKFKVKNSMGQQIYFAAEESGFCSRQCCGPHRGFTMHVADNMGQEVIRATRHFKCCAGFCWCACFNCCAYEIVVEAPVGTVCGYVKQSCSLWFPCFEVMNENHETVLKMEGPCCICPCPCCDVNFNVYSMDGSKKVGKVSKQWSGLVKEVFTEADNFGVSFPMDLDVKVKATLIGAVFLINMMFFEKNQEKEDKK